MTYDPKTLPIVSLRTAKALASGVGTPRWPIILASVFLFGALSCANEVMAQEKKNAISLASYEKLLARMERLEAELVRLKKEQAEQPKPSVVVVEGSKPATGPSVTGPPTSSYDVTQGTTRR